MKPITYSEADKMAESGPFSFLLKVDDIPASFGFWMPMTMEREQRVTGLAPLFWRAEVYILNRLEAK